MASPDDKSFIDELNKSLYSRTAPDVRTRRKLRFSDNEVTVQKDWKHEDQAGDAETALNTTYEHHHMSFFTKLFIASIVFFIGAIGIGAYIFLNGSNLISANNIAVDISGPVSVAGGEPVSFDIKVTNHNNVDLQVADLSVDFPDGTTQSDDPTQVLKNYRQLLGDIPAGGLVQKTVSAIMFGEENLQKAVTANVTYSIKGSTAVFTKTQTYDILISSSPINVSVNSFKEITSGQEFDMKVSIKSNSKQVLKSVLLKASYPIGYTFLSSSIRTLSNNTTWFVGDVPPGGTKTITIHGKLDGEDTDTKAFHFTVGAQSATNQNLIGTQYLVTEQDVSIQKPFISVGIAVDNDNASTDHVGQFDASERVAITWFNNLTTSVSNLHITATLSGSAFDKTSVHPDQGYYDSANNSIVWNQQTNQDLTSIGPGETGTVTFTMTPKDFSTDANKIANPVISISTNVSATRSSEANVPQSLASAVVRNIKISSDVSLSGRVVRTVGPFTNSGPIPPKADQSTTYTIIWDVDNTANAVNNAQVTATLPPYMTWLSMFSPASEDVSYDQSTGLVTWNVGNLSTYTHGTSKRREVMFQVSFKPNVTQAQTMPNLIGAATLTATDAFTGASLSSKQEALTTRFSTDPSYVEGNQTVSQ